MKSLTIRQRQVRGVVVVDLEGSITLGQTNRQLHEAIRQAVAERKRYMILNLARVTNIDSSGLGEIIAGYATMSNAGGALKLTNLPKSLTDLMLITKLLTVFEIFEDERAAVDSFEDDAERLHAGPEDSRGGVTQELPENFEAEAMAKSSIY
jgi:anti-sigma B factor antagonist